MPAYHFEGVKDTGFIVSGYLGAANEAEALLKARRFCNTVDHVHVYDVTTRQREARVDKTVAVRRPVIALESFKKGRAISMAVSMWALCAGNFISG